MQVSGTYTLPGSFADIWQAMISPEVLKAVTPGCVWITPKSLEDSAVSKTDETPPINSGQDSAWPSGFTAELAARIGPITPSWQIDIDISDVVMANCTPVAWRIDVSARGTSGRLGGFAHIRLEVHPTESSKTFLRYEAGGEASGPITALGSRLLARVAPKLADRFFAKFAEEVEGRKDVL